MVIRAGILAS